jgi:hypothetical protein
MNRIEVVATLSLPPGTELALLPEQAETRQPSLEPLGEGWYRVRRAVQFKAGEALGIDRSLPKRLDGQWKPLRGRPPKGLGHAKTADE